MDIRNQTLATELFLMGFSRDFGTNIVLFVVFLFVYLITFVGNSIMICVIVLTPRFHIPMYYFLCVLSCLDLSYSSTVVPKLLADLLSTTPAISIGACATQVYLILLLGGTECLLLTLMAYDRYLAICRPLHYPVLMRWKMCHLLTGMIGAIGFLMFVLPSLLMPLPLCYPNQLNHFMCEVLALLKLACVKTHLRELLIFYMSFMSLLIPFILILVSYTCIIASVLKIHSTGRSKAFSTCTSHISVVVLFFGTGMSMYFSPPSMFSSNREKYISVCYGILTPMLNPIIYSLNNRDVKVTFRKFFFRLVMPNDERTNICRE